MAKIKSQIPANVVEKNIRLTGKIMQYLLDNPQIFDSLPNNFELVILPEDDPEMRLYSLELLDKYGSEGKPIVFARIKTQLEATSLVSKPNLFAPVPQALH